MDNTENTKIALFEAKKIRKILYKDEWWFVVSDVVNALVDSVNISDYINKIRRRDPELNKGYGQIVHPLLIKTLGGPQKLNCANTEGIFRIIQSVPSPKAEPFKLWLAKVGHERIAEIENPELAMNRMKMLYEKKGYPKEWIDKRTRGIAVRQTLTDEWKNRGIKHSVEYAILTDEIMQGTFDMKVSEYKKFKGLNRENLRDHMDDLEIILTMLSEATTTRLTKDRDSKGFPKLKKDAHDGGSIAGQTRKNIEAKTKTKIISSSNFNNLNTKQII